MATGPGPRSAGGGGGVGWPRPRWRWPEAVEVVVMVWAALPTAKDCWTWVGGGVVGVAGLVGVEDAGADTGVGEGRAGQ